MAIETPPVPDAAPGTGGVTAPSLATRAIESTAMLLLVGAAAVALLQVFFRYGLDNALPWPEELAQWMFVWAIFVGAGIAAGRRGHIAIETFSPRLSPAARERHRDLVDALVLFAGAILVGEGLSFVAKTSYVTPGLGWSTKYLYAAVPVGGLLTLIGLTATRLHASTARARAFAPLALAVVFYAVLLVAGERLPAGAAAPVLMVVALGLIALETPIAHSFVIGTFCAFVPQGDLMLVTIPQNMGSSLNSFTLLAIPFFILAASLMNHAGITRRLVDLASVFFGHLRGGLGHVNVATNTMMGGISGSSMADAAAIGKILIPEMTRRGYTAAYGCALTAASGTLANLIPPSLGLIIYGALASASVGALFVATIVPGLLTAAALAIVVHLTAGRSTTALERASVAQRGRALGSAVPALLLPVVIVGGVRFGVFTATESGAVAAAYALACGVFLYRALTLRGGLAAAREALGDTVAVSFIIAAAAPFAWTLTAEQAPQKVAAALSGLIASPWLLLAVINGFLLAVGLFMEMIAAMVILVPILVPIIKSAGVDVVHFGIVLVLNLVIGALTPPLGMLVFTTSRVGQVPVAQVFRQIGPFLAALVVVLLAVSYLPVLTVGVAARIGP